MAKSEKIRSTGKCATDLPVGGRKMARQRGDMARGPARRARRVNYLYCLTCYWAPPRVGARRRVWTLRRSGLAPRRDPARAGAGHTRRCVIPTVMGANAGRGIAVDFYGWCVGGHCVRRCLQYIGDRGFWLGGLGGGETRCLCSDERLVRRWMGGGRDLMGLWG